MAKFRVFLGTEPLDLGAYSKMEEAVMAELSAIANYQDPATTARYYYTNDEEEAKALVIEVKKVYDWVGWKSDGVFVEPV
jgi:hypothetical protein